MEEEIQKQEAEKYIGVGLALSSSILIGTSFILTKMGLNASHTNGSVKGDSFSYLKNIIWWAGLLAMILGEITNFAAYSFAPAILVTPLGAGSVVVNAILASIFLDEVLNRDGKIGCALCIIGSVIIVLHSPPEETITSTSQLLQYALRPGIKNFLLKEGFIVYLSLSMLASVILIYKVAPIYGKTHMVVYISICSLVGSISVMACKGFGIAIKLTGEGDNQFTSPAPYIFGATVIICALTQINYFNKALDLFSTNLVTPIYYVMFTTTTIIASIILFEGIDKATPVYIMIFNVKIEVASIFIGFLIILIGVFMVNSAKKEAAYQATLSSPNLTSTTDIPLKSVISNTKSPGYESTQHLRFAEITENSNFTIDDVNEMEGVNLP